MGLGDYVSSRSNASIVDAHVLTYRQMGVGFVRAELLHYICGGNACLPAESTPDSIRPSRVNLMASRETFILYWDQDVNKDRRDEGWKSLLQCSPCTKNNASIA